jgi:polysaccharide export outer membrane protein
MERPNRVIIMRLKIATHSVVKMLLGIIAATLLTACTTQGLEKMAPVEIPTYSEEEYKIGVGDSISIKVWGNEKLSIQVPVRPDGKISMSLIGDVLAADSSAEVLAETINGRLLEFIKNPQVTVIVSNPSSADFQARVRVTGAVTSPQSVPFRSGITVLDLVLMAGGVNQYAVADNAKLYRRVSGEVKVYRVNLDDILKYGKLDTNYMLMPSDIITVPERSF